MVSPLLMMTWAEVEAVRRTLDFRPRLPKSPSVNLAVSRVAACS